MINVFSRVALKKTNDKGPVPWQLKKKVLLLEISNHEIIKNYAIKLLESLERHIKSINIFFDFLQFKCSVNK